MKKRFSAHCFSGQFPALYFRAKEICHSLYNSKYRYVRCFHETGRKRYFSTAPAAVLRIWRTNKSDDTAEPFAGGSFYRLTTRPEENKSTYAVNMAGFTGGITFLHPIDREEQQSLFVTPKINVMFPPSADKHPFSLVQRETVLLSISAGYRYQF